LSKHGKDSDVGSKATVISFSMFIGMSTAATDYLCQIDAKKENPTFDDIL
jgi:hypothetical protein